ncbi:MAG: O-methyltransferase [Bacteroidetes bacterium]|nr:O-methyltransferase [Bacteroidota bacterium]
MEFISSELSDYVDAHTSLETSVLKQLNRETNSTVLMPRMLSGNLQGQFLSMVSHMIQPMQILEIGTYTGYSAICLAAGLKPGGMLHTIDINDELEPMVKRYINTANLSDKIKTYSGDARSMIPSINETFDLVFIDADKINYSVYYDLVFDQVRPGGFILADNVLWSGKVLEKPSAMDADTKAIDTFNKKVHADERVQHVLLPVRDGLMLIRKI